MTLSLIRPVCIQDVTPYAPVAAEPCTVGCGLTTGGDSIGTSGVGDAAMAAADADDDCGAPNSGGYAPCSGFPAAVQTHGGGTQLMTP